MRIQIFSILIILILSGCKSIVVSESEKNYLLSETGKHKYYLVKLIRHKQKEGILGEMPMLIVNSEPVFIHYRKENGMPNTNKKYIKSIKIVKGEIGAKTYGAAAKYGLIIINTYGKQEKLP